MYLLATDYDGTFKKNNHSIYLNIDAIKKFRSQGNKFAIVTGRSFSSIKKEIYKHYIEYDYISCNNGSITFDNNDKIVTKTTLSNDIVQIIINELEKNNSVTHINIYGEYDKIFNEDNIYGNHDKIVNEDNILEFSVRFKTRRDAYLFKKHIENILNNIRCYGFENRLFIGSNRTKADAVNYIKILEKISEDKVYTIGDDLNDFEMLKQFNGYKMLNCNSKMWFNNIPFTREVYALVKKINK